MNYLAKYKTVIEVFGPSSYMGSEGILGKESQERSSNYSFEAISDEEAKKIAKKYKKEEREKWKKHCRKYNEVRIKSGPTLEELVEVRKII